MRISTAHLFSLFFLVGVTTQAVFAQYSTSSRPPNLYINSVEQKGDYFEVKYEITMAGYVELHLIDENDEKLWVTGKVTDRSVSEDGNPISPETMIDIHRIPIGPLEPGKRYSFILKYKGKEYPSFFYTSG